MTRIQQQDMTELGKQIQDTFAKRSALTAELLNGVAYPAPDILFDREHRLDLGGVHVRLMWRGPATMHTRGDTMVFVEEDRVLFTGDVVMSQRFLAAQTNSSLNTWLATLDELAALKPAQVVPSHGSIGDATLIAQDRAFLQAVQTRVGELKRTGKTVDEAIAAVVAEIAAVVPGMGQPIWRRGGRARRVRRGALTLAPRRPDGSDRLSPRFFCARAGAGHHELTTVDVETDLGLVVAVRGQRDRRVERVALEVPLELQHEIAALLCDTRHRLRFGLHLTRDLRDDLAPLVLHGERLLETALRTIEHERPHPEKIGGISGRQGLCAGGERREQ